MRKGTGIVNRPIDEVFDKVQPYTESDALVLQVVGNTVNAIMDAFNTNYNTAWQLAKRLEVEMDITLIDGRELIQDYPYYWSKIYFHAESRKIYETVHSLELFAFEHGIKLTKKHCEDKIRYSQRANMPRFNNNLYFFMTGDLKIEHFIQNPKGNQANFALTYMQKYGVPTDFDVPFFVKSKAYFQQTGRYRWDAPKFINVKPTCNNAIAWLFENK